jgi:hypothetical protein
MPTGLAAQATRITGKFRRSSTASTASCAPARSRITVVTNRSIPGGCLEATRERRCSSRPQKPGNPHSQVPLSIVSGCQPGHRQSVCKIGALRTLCVDYPTVREIAPAVFWSVYGGRTTGPASCFLTSPFSSPTTLMGEHRREPPSDHGVWRSFELSMSSAERLKHCRSGPPFHLVALRNSQ